MTKKKSISLWVTAFILMAMVASYQRMTGPTYPVKDNIYFAGKDVKYKLLRTETCGNDAAINIIAQSPLSAIIQLKRFKSHDSLRTEKFVRSGDQLIFKIPHQPAAGKVQYQVFIEDSTKNVKQALTNVPILIRYKGDVPAFILIPHIILMFGAMFFAARTAFEAYFKGDNVYKFTILTSIFLFIGGLIMGPIVQQYAFGAYWTGWPFGHDMTDNKTLFALIFWIVALVKIRKNPEAGKWAIIAFVLMMVVYLIPHSVLGSELDYTKQIAN